MTNDSTASTGRPTRRQFLEGAVASSLAMAVTLESASAQPAHRTSTPSAAMPLTENWDKTFPKSDRVDHRKVTFKNRYGITLAADLYTPREHGTAPLAAVAVSGPFGAVKEQSSGLYAQTM